MTKPITLGAILCLALKQMLNHLYIRLLIFGGLNRLHLGPSFAKFWRIVYSLHSWWSVIYYNTFWFFDQCFTLRFLRGSSSWAVTWIAVKSSLRTNLAAAISHPILRNQFAIYSVPWFISQQAYHKTKDLVYTQVEILRAKARENEKVQYIVLLIFGWYFHAYL